MPTVAVIGASNDREKYGNRAVRAYLKQGWTVYPINVHEEKIEGLKAFKSILDVPGQVDRASFYVHPEIGVKLLDEVKKKNIKEIYINPGAESDELVARGKKLGLNLLLACSIRAIGEDPDEF